MATRTLSRLRSLSTRARLRCENILTVTGLQVEVKAFQMNSAMGVSPEGLAFLPRGLAFLERIPPAPLSFHRLLPVGGHVGTGDRELQEWGSMTDAYGVTVSPGWPRTRGRSSIVYEFSTEPHAPLRWLQAAAGRHPTLRFGLKYALPHEPAAFETEYQKSQLIFETQVNYRAWVWDNKVHKPMFFADLKHLLRFPDGRVPRKSKIKVSDVEARLHSQGSYASAIALLALKGWGDAGTGGVVEGAQTFRLTKLFHQKVLPEFVQWLHSTKGVTQIA